MASEKGLYECEIEVPNSYTVYVNDIKIKDENKVTGDVNEDLNELSKYAKLPYITQYKIANLLKEPTIKIVDGEGKEVEYTKDGNLFKVDLKTEKIEDEKTAMAKIKGKVDVLQIAKEWSLFLSNDLGGERHGFYKIAKYLVKDSYMYKYAYKWATNVDITFISNHSLEKTPFVNTKVGNFEIYSENAFSCEVYLEKKMIINKSGGTKLTDTMSERMYFAYYEGEWKLVNMKAISKNK